MRRTTAGRLVLLIGLFLVSSIAHASTHDFFKGKTVRLLVGTSPGGAMDDWARLIAPHLGRNIPGNPDIIVQNMAGAGTVVAANYVYNVAKPDGLTLGVVNPGIYVDQLLGVQEVKFDWPKLSMIGSPERVDQVLFIRSDFPQKSLDDLRKAKEAPRCGALSRTTLAYFLPKLLEDGLGIKMQMVLGYGGGGDMNLAMEKGEIHCRAGTVSAYVGREPTRTWIKNGFVHALVHSGAKRYASLPEVPTYYELAEKYKAPDAIKRVAKVLFSAGDFGRPFIAPPSVAPDRLKVLRDAFAKTMNDPALLADTAKRQWDLDPTSGAELEAIGKEVMVQPPEVVERVKRLMEK